MATTQPFAFPIRLPDALQAEALRLLDARRAGDRMSSWWSCGQRWIALPPSARVRPGSRWSSTRRGAAATAVGKSAARWSRRGGSCEPRLARKRVFQTILPLLTAGLIRPADGKRTAKKGLSADQRTGAGGACTEQQEAGEEADAYVAMTNLIEQACNYYLRTGAFPTTYEEVQAVPVRGGGPAALCRRRWHARWADLSGTALGGTVL